MHQPDLFSQTLHTRLESIRQALGAAELFVARRRCVDVPAARSHEILAVASEAGPAPPERGAAFAEFVDGMIRTALDRQLELDEAKSGAGEGVGPTPGRLEGFVYPRDRLPSVFFVARFERGRDPGPRRREVARAGMHALALALAPPPWMPLARRPAAPTEPVTERVEHTPLADAVAAYERELLRRALCAAEGNKTEVARRLRISRQGLHRKLRRYGLVPESDDAPHGVDSDQGSA